MYLHQGTFSMLPARKLYILASQLTRFTAHVGQRVEYFITFGAEVIAGDSRQRSRLKFVYSEQTLGPTAKYLHMVNFILFSQ